MKGLGDNIHQRAVIRQLLKKPLKKIWLKTPWPNLYLDMMGGRLITVPSGTPLRTQAKNEVKQRSLYGAQEVPHGVATMRVYYTHDEIRSSGSILDAMLKHCKLDPADNDFTMRVPGKWLSAADASVWIEHSKAVEMVETGKPILLYRPLVVRREWSGCDARNPTASAYHELIMSIRERFFVVSVADLQAGEEWIVSEDIGADLELHHGQLSMEALVGLTKLSAMVFCSPGFAIAMGQMTGTPTVCVFGGHESSASYSTSTRFAPWLPIDPISPCQCFSKSHNCDKRIDLVAATRRLQEFAHEAANKATERVADQAG